MMPGGRVGIYGMTIFATDNETRLGNRTQLLRRFRANRARSAKLFSIVAGALYDRPLHRRLPFIFYVGHLPAFNILTLEAAYGLTPLDTELEALFRRGIDPSDDAAADAMQPAGWPQLQAVERFAASADERVERLLASAPLSDSQRPMLDRAQAWYTILEHEAMHQETLLYLITCLDHARKRISPAPLGRSAVILDPADRVPVPAGHTRLGARREAIEFGWDNEFDEHGVDVAAFTVDRRPVTNQQYLAYVNRGGSRPQHWSFSERTWWLDTVTGRVELPLQWPAYVSPDQAAAYARAHGGRIMTEAEYQRAAYGTPDGVERQYPWGNETPHPRHGNFGFRRLTPEPNGSSPAGASAWGIEDLAGNGWEITATPFTPFEGFRPHASYPEYSADFFDGKHVVVKGASPGTDAMLLRPSLRNWFYRDYPYAFTKFRLAYS